MVFPYTGPSGGKLLVPDETKEVFADWYGAYHEKCKQDTLISTMLPRIQSSIWKIALLYAAQDGMAEITPEYLEKAISVGAYIEASITELFKNFGASHGKVDEQKIVQYLKSRVEPISARDLYHNLGLSLAELEKIMPPLMRIGIVKADTRTAKNGRKTTYYSAFL